MLSEALKRLFANHKDVLYTASLSYASSQQDTSVGCMCFYTLLIAKVNDF